MTNNDNEVSGADDAAANPILQPSKTVFARTVEVSSQDVATRDSSSPIHPVGEPSATGEESFLPPAPDNGDQQEDPATVQPPLNDKEEPTEPTSTNGKPPRPDAETKQQASPVVAEAVGVVLMTRHDGMDESSTENKNTNIDNNEGGLSRSMKRIGSLQDMKFADDIEEEIRQPRYEQRAIAATPTTAALNQLTEDQEQDSNTPSSTFVVNKNQAAVEVKVTPRVAISSVTFDDNSKIEQEGEIRQPTGDAQNEEEKEKVVSKNQATAVKSSPTIHPAPGKPSSSTVTLALLVALFLGLTGTAIGIIALVRAQDSNDGGVRTGMETIENAADCQEEQEGTSCASLEGEEQSLLEVIQERGYLQCGMLFEQLGFLGQVGVNRETEEPVYAGLDMDLCRVLAAAIFKGDSEAYRIQIVSSEDRWTVLNATDSMDVLFRSTRTMERQIYEPSVGAGFEFSQPYFYDGLGFGGLEEFVRCAENGTVNGTCAPLRICVLGASTHETVVKGLVPPENIVVESSADDLYRAFPSACNVLAGEQTFISQAALRQRGYQGSYVVGTGVFSQEPLCLVTRRGDLRWSNFVNAILNALISAEENGFTQSSAVSIPATDLFGASFERSLENAISVRGNYGDLYAHNLEAFIPRGGLNGLNVGAAPRVYSFPFGNVDTEGPNVEDISPTIKAIRERGFVNCGIISGLEGLAAFDSTKKDYSGFEIDLCRAISVAVFDGVDRTLITVTTDSDRVQMLNDNRIDVLALYRRTWEDDVMVPLIGMGLSFADPFFYPGFGLAGLPTHVNCVERLDVFSPDCQDVRLCIRPATVIYNLFSALLPDSSHLVPKPNVIEMYAGLENGECNAFTALDLQIQSTPLAAVDYEGPYIVGTRLFARFSIALTTREDDPLWSAFVDWIFLSLVYAEAKGIEQANANLMPTTNLFGPLYTDIFFHAVSMVGNYGEIYQRTLGQILPRSAVHLLNDNSKPRLFAF